MIRKYYFINKFETNNIDKLDNQTTIIYRNYSSETVNEKLIQIVQKLLDSENILLVQSDTWSKSGEINNNSGIWDNNLIRYDGDKKIKFSIIQYFISQIIDVIYHFLDRNFQ